MFNSMWGGNKIYAAYGKMAHNFIQEGHDAYGILATVALIGLMIGFVRNVVKSIFVSSLQP